MGSPARKLMNVLDMTDSELYEMGLKELKPQLGPAYTARFLQQCKPNEYDYSVERHKLLANQPSIDKIVEPMHRSRSGANRGRTYQS